MGLTLDQEERFNDIKNAVDEDPKRLSKWEHGFCYNGMDAEWPGLFTAYEENGAEIHVSPKQWVLLDRIAEKYGR